MNAKKLTKSEMKDIFSAQDLRKYRDEQCLSQEYMANLLDINQSTYQRIEAGKIKLSIDHIVKLTTIFNKSLQRFSESEFTIDVQHMKNTINHLEKMIELLEEKISLKDLKIEELIKQINDSKSNII